MSDKSADTRWIVHFSGHVQGVGFRYTAQSLARGFDVTGYVQNLPDGRVKLVAEGAEGELKRFVKALEAQMAVHVSGTKIDRAAPTGEFTNFGVRQ